MKMKTNHRFEKELNGEKKIKTIITIVLASMLLLSVGFVMAAQENAFKSQDENIASGGQNESRMTFEQLNQIAAAVRAGNYVGPNGEQIQIQAEENNRIRLRVQDAEARTDLELFSTDEGLRAKLSNGKNAQIKVMPNTASETALQKLRLRNCNESNNCSIELKEVGQGNQTRLAYVVQAERSSRILGLFQAKMEVRAQVDAETGETIRVGKPWWAFLATEPEEQ